jgi:uncharacterized protein YjbJ (UPF0337 family)
MVGTVKEKWGKLTDDDLKVIEGSVELRTPDTLSGMPVFKT